MSAPLFNSPIFDQVSATNNGEAVSSPLVTNLTTSSFLDGPRSSFLISGEDCVDKDHR